MRWMTEPPKVPGWYFYQCTEGDHPIRVGYVDFQIYPHIPMAVWTLFGCHNLHGQAIRDDWSVPIQDIRSEHRWAGPINEPEELNEMDK